MTNLTHPRTPGLFRRLAAICYDSLLIIAIWIIVTAVVMAFSGGRLAQPETSFWLRTMLQLALLIATWLFFAWFWVHGGQTLGMRAWRIKLVSCNGTVVSWNQTLGRFAVALLSTGVFGLGYLWVLFDPDGCSWHDRLSNTRLILLPTGQK